MSSTVTNEGWHRTTDFTEFPFAIWTATLAVNHAQSIANGFSQHIRYNHIQEKTTCAYAHTWPWYGVLHIIRLYRDNSIKGQVCSTSYMIYVNNVKQKFRENTSQTPHGLSTDLPPQQNPTIPIDENPLLFKALITCFVFSAASTYIIHARLK